MGNRHLLNKIESRISENIINDVCCEDEKLFNVVDFIYSFNFEYDFECPEVFYKYDRLCKKIDVVGKVYTYYSIDLSKKMTETELTKPQLERFSLNLMFLAVHKHDFKFINTLLKIVDSPILNISESLILLILECKKRVFTDYE